MSNGTPEKPAAPCASGANSDGDTRDHIGLTVVRWSGGILLALVLVIVIAIAVLSRPGTASTDGLSAKDAVGAYLTLLTTILPVIGTWVGTVLAFYFTSKSYKAASEENRRTMESAKSERLRSISVSEAMVPFEKIEEVIKFTDVNTTKVSDLIKKLTDKINRLIVADAGQIIKHVIHDSLVYKFKSNAAGGADPVLSDLLANAEYAGKVSAIGFVDSRKTLADVQAIMDTIPDCRDVFVTSNGLKGGHAIGWITDRIVAQKAKA